MSRMSELHAMNASLAAFNAAIQSHFNMPPTTTAKRERITKHKAEASIKGHLVDLEYSTRYDFLDHEERIMWETVTVLHDGDDITDWLKPNILSNLHKEVESHFERRGEDHSEDWQ